MKIITGREMAEIDRKTIEEIGMPGPVLMENAARAVCRVFGEMTCGDKKPETLIICGSGNNGGDGFCAARILAGWGFPVKIAHIGRPQVLKDDARLYYNIACKYGVEIITIKEESDLKLFEDALSSSEWIIDALFGTGLTEPVRGIASKVLKIASEAGKKCIAIDIPSGINSNNGSVLAGVIPADATVTFGLPKMGYFIFPGANFIGKLIVADIGFPNNLLENESFKISLTDSQMVSDLIPPRSINSNKGSNGKLTVIGGSRQLIGAAVLAGYSALRSGCGYVNLLIPYLMETVVKGMAPDIVTVGLPDAEGGYISTDSVDIALENLKHSDAVAIGPGIGIKPFTRGFIIDILEENKIPAVIDADALNCLALEENWTRNPDVPWILTPHPKEAARLLKISLEEVLADPLDALAKLVEKYKATVLLKGAYTLIMGINRDVYVNSTGNPALAVMGTGDILTGIIGSLLARGVEPFKAAACGAYIHGIAGDIAAEKMSGEGILSSEILKFVSDALDRIRRGDSPCKIRLLK